MLEAKRKIPTWKRQLWRLLHKLYSSNKGASGLLQHRITPLGYIAGLILLFAMSLRMGSSQNTLFGLIACIGAIFVVSFVSVFLRRAKLKINRVLPRMGTVGTAFDYSVEVENLSKFSVSAAKLRELPLLQTPSEDVFVYSVEPGEQLRNAFDRLFVVYRWKWLTGSRMKFFAIDSDPVVIPGRKSKSYKMTLTPKRRGRLVLSGMRVILPDPLCLFQRCKKVEQEPQSIIVLPKRYKIRNLEIIGEAQNQVGGEAQSRQIGQSSEFVSLRDYRPGDPIKHVDWKSWAKTGEPVVREYEDVFYPHHGLVLDTGVHPIFHEEFEEAVSVAASFACSIDTNEGLLDLVLIQQDTKVVTVGKGVEQLDEMMEVLACAEMETRPNWEQLTLRVAQIAPGLSGCIMIFAEWSEERALLVNKTLSQGVNVVAFLVYKDEDEALESLMKHKAGTTVHLLKVGEIQEGLDRVLESSLSS